jgi:hypothetical protein
VCEIRAREGKAASELDEMGERGEGRGVRQIERQRGREKERKGGREGGREMEGEIEGERITNIIDKEEQRRTY